MQKIPIINRTCEFAIRLLLRTFLDVFVVCTSARLSLCVCLLCCVYILITQNKTTVFRFMLGRVSSSSCLDQCSCVLSSLSLFLFLEHRHSW